MSTSRLPLRGPLDWVAHNLEVKNAISATPKPKHSDASEWLKEPSRTALFRAMFQACQRKQRLTRTEHYVIVKGKGFLSPTRENDADYPFAKTDNLFKDASRFALKYKRQLVGKKLFEQFIDACEVDLKVKYVPPRKINLIQLTLRPLVRPRFSRCLPLPSDKVELRCTASDATWQAMQSLTRAFGTSRAPIVLITGPPGSGKEAYARAVHFGQSRNNSRDADALVTLSFSEIGAEGLKKYIGGGLLGRLQRNRGTLFLDEVDKTTREARSYLLRILENRKFEDAHGHTNVCDQVAFVIAAGAPLAALRSKGPADFWTRMEVHVPVADPLTAGSQPEREKLLQEFFKFFWWDAVSGWLGGQLSNRPIDDWGRFLIGKPSLAEMARKVFWVAIGKPDGVGFECAWAVTKTAEHFASVLSPHLERRHLSLRGLRSAVGAVQRALRADIMSMALDQGSAVEEKFIENARKEIHSAIGTVLQVIPDG